MKLLKRIIQNPRNIVAYINKTGVFNFLSDKTVVSMLWWVKTGKRLDINNPKSFNEKIQYLKLFNRDKRLPILVDKYLVREYISKVLSEDCLIPLLGVWDTPDDIDFGSLPQQFVLKCNHNAAVGLTICRNKEQLDVQKTKRELRKGLKQNFYYSSREWAYKNVKRKIICEKYMEDSSSLSGLRDYKFFCFNGEAKFVYISEGLEKHETAHISFYDLAGKEMPFKRSDYEPFDKAPNLPENFNELIEAANIISTDLNIPFVRVDLYSINGKMYFSELTFYPNSGYIPFEPKEWDETIGSWLSLNR